MQNNHSGRCVCGKRLKNADRVTLLIAAVIIALTFPVITSAFPSKVKSCGRIYIPNGYEDSVSVIDITTNTVTATIPVGVSPAMLFATPDGRKVYVANWYFKDPIKDPAGHYKNYFQIINTVDNSVKAIEVPDLPFGAKTSPDNKRFYVALFTSFTVEAYDTKSDKRVGIFTFEAGLGEAPLSVEVSPDNSILYVSFANGTIGAYDAYSGSIIQGPKPVDTNVGPGTHLPAWISLTADGTKLYSLNAVVDSITLIDANSLEVEKTFYMTATGGAAGDGSGPIVSNNSPDGNKVYISGWGEGGEGGIVKIVEAETGSDLGMMRISGVAQSVAFNCDGSLGYITHGGPDSPDIHEMTRIGVTDRCDAPGEPGGPNGEVRPGEVVVFDPTDDTIIGPTITVGYFPGTSVYVPTSNRMNKRCVRGRTY